MIVKNSEFVINSENDSDNLALDIAKNLRVGDVIVFYGDLGAGKTYLCRRIIQCLVDDKNLNVISPTYNLLQTYQCKDYEIFHYDLYRLKHYSEIYELDIEEALLNNITLIEWGQLIEHILPPNFYKLNIDILDDKKRKIIIN